MTARTPRRTRSLSAAAVAVVGAVALSACTGVPDRPAKACPQVLLERDTAKLTVFRDGPGRDLTDVVFEAEMMGFNGDCKPGKPGEPVSMVLQAVIAVNQGPAWTGTRGALPYFLAVPAYFPASEAKQEFSASFTFPSPTTTRIVLRDEPVNLTLPMAEDAQRAPAVYFGFQLTHEQLEYNRANR